MAQLKSLKEQLLKETANFYTNKNRAIVREKGLATCVYETKSGKNCGIGRICTKSGINKIKKLKLNKYAGVKELRNNIKLSSILKKRYKPLHNNITFLIDVQSLHDNDNYWDNKGLTFTGITFVHQLCSKYKLNVKNILKP